MRLPVQDIGEFHNEQKAGPTPGTGLRFEETRASMPIRPKHYERSRSGRIACFLVASSHGLRRAKGPVPPSARARRE